MWDLDYKESWVPKNWCFWTVMLEKTLESPLDCKEIQPVHPKGNQSWIFIGRTDDEAETPILWPPDEKSWLICKTLMLGKIEGRRRRGWQRMRWLDGITDSMDMGFSKLQQLVMDREALVCCSPWSSKELDMTERLYWVGIGSVHLQIRAAERVREEWFKAYEKGLRCEVEYHFYRSEFLDHQCQHHPRTSQKYRFSGPSQTF